MKRVLLRLSTTRLLRLLSSEWSSITDSMLKKLQSDFMRLLLVTMLPRLLLVVVVAFSVVSLSHCSSGQQQQEAPIGCYVSGECLFSLIVDDQPAEAPVDCLELCQDFRHEDYQCNYFTYYSDSGVSKTRIHQQSSCVKSKHNVMFQFCFMFQNCAEFGSDGCDDCTSGDSVCPTDPCFVPGIRC